MTRKESLAMARLAAPLVVAQVAQMSMGVVGTVVAGRLGVREMAAQALASTVFALVVVAGWGVMCGLDPHVSRAIGASDPATAGRLHRQGLWLALAVGGSMAVLTLLCATPLLHAMGQSAALVNLTEQALAGSVWGILPGLAFSSYRSLCSAVGRPQTVMVAAVVGNVLHVPLSFWLAERHGVFGIGLAATLGRLLLVALVAVFVRMDARFQVYRGPWRGPVWHDLRPLLRSGLPLGMQYGAEVAGFVLITLWMGLIGESQLAAHEVALSVCSVVFQVPSALATAAAVRVGQATGRGDLTGEAVAGWTGFGLGACYAVLAAAAILALRGLLVGAYLPGAPPAVQQMALQFLGVAACFQIADAVQGVGFGVLRGLDDTRLPVLFNLAGFGLVGLPVSWYLVFKQHHPPDRLWWGLTVALAIIAVLLVLRFRWQIRHRATTAEILLAAPSGSQ
jgi:MATE family multidrug resistance protein